MKQLGRFMYVLPILISMFFAPVSFAFDGDDFGDVSNRLAECLVEMQETHCALLFEEACLGSTRCSWNSSEEKCLLGAEAKKEIYSRTFSAGATLAVGNLAFLSVLYLIASCFQPAPAPAPAREARLT